MRKNTVGKCKLCGKEMQLTFEHVPPENAFNFVSVKEYSYKDTEKLLTGEDGRMPWDFSGLNGKINQRGAGDYYLCPKCNNDTGAWYMSEYVELTKVFHTILFKERPPIGETCSFCIHNVHPLRIFKAALTLFCDINYDCFGDEQLRNYLLSKDSNDSSITEKYSIYINILGGEMRRVNPISGAFLKGIGGILVSEIFSYPIGLTLFIDKPSQYTPKGFCINHFSKYQYDDCCDIDFTNVPILEVNCLLPLDFRRKEDFGHIIK